MQPWFAALELGGTKALCAVGPSHDHVEAEARIETSSPESTLSAVETFLAEHRGRVVALGIASFGPLELDPRASAWGHMLSTPKPGWSAVSIAPRLSAVLGVPTRIDTDVNAAAMAEQRWGAAQGEDPCVYVTVGTGIGVGVVIDGTPLHGLMHPELGHIPAAPYCDFAGACRFHGRCIEGLASGEALRQRTGCAPETLPRDHAVWDLTARYLAQLAATCVLAYAPRRMVFSGGVMQHPDMIALLRARLLEQLAGYVPRAELTPEGVAQYAVLAALGQRAGLHGAFALAEEALR